MLWIVSRSREKSCEITQFKCKESKITLIDAATVDGFAHSPGGIPMDCAAKTRLCILKGAALVS